MMHHLKKRKKEASEFKLEQDTLVTTHLLNKGSWEKEDQVFEGRGGRMSICRRGV